MSAKDDTNELLTIAHLMGVEDAKDGKNKAGFWRRESLTPRRWKRRRRKPIFGPMGRRGK